MKCKCGFTAPAGVEQSEVCRLCLPVGTAQDTALRATSLARRYNLLPTLDGLVRCTDCPKPATDYDHRDYDKPLSVEPVCHGCNIKRGPAKNAGMKQDDQRKLYESRVASLRKLAPPDATQHIPHPWYAKALVVATNRKRENIAFAVGIAPSTLRAHCNGQSPMPYATQYALENLVVTTKQEQQTCTPDSPRSKPSPK